VGNPGVEKLQACGTFGVQHVFVLADRIVLDMRSHRGRLVG